jgi:hypothetical protein
MSSLRGPAVKDGRYELFKSTVKCDGAPRPSQARFSRGVFLKREPLTSSCFFRVPLPHAFSRRDRCSRGRHAGNTIAIGGEASSGNPDDLRPGDRGDATPESFVIAVNGPESLQARAVALAVAGNECNSLLTGVSGWSIPR